MTQSISQIVLDQYGIETKPGTKSKYPFCDHKTFSIKRDDTIGKCFHPTCGRYITPTTHDNRLMRKLHNVLKDIYYDFHRELLCQGNDYPKNAYGYLVLEREIHPDSTEFVLLMSKFGINLAEKIFRYVIEDLRIYALKNGQKTDVHKLAYYNPKTFTVYVFNCDNQIYRISPEVIELVDNGTDGVLFLNDPSAQPFNVKSLIHLIDGSWLDRLIFSKINFFANTQ